RGSTVRVARAEPLVVDGDELRLEQALGNLVDNALRHGGGDVELSARAHDGVVELHVRDEGPGFDQAFVPVALDRFTRGSDARGRGGTGLGLAIVDAIARAHGGRAAVGAAPGGGADVSLSVPA
ncbi:MAG: ATP-binding protein, partial [Solirubrobacteraceae bacterium]